MTFHQQIWMLWAMTQVMFHLPQILALIEGYSLDEEGLTRWMADQPLERLHKIANFSKSGWLFVGMIIVWPKPL